MRLMHGLVVAIVCSGLTSELAASRGHAAPPPLPKHAVVPPHPAANPPKSHLHQSPLFPKEALSNPALVARLQPLLPPGESMANAAAGFKNRGQFIAALHVSRNLNIPFDQLKAEMVPPAHDSLGQAIHDLRPGIRAKTAKAEVKLAEKETKADLKTIKPLEKPIKPLDKPVKPLSPEKIDRDDR